MWIGCSIRRVFQKWALTPFYYHELTHDPDHPVRNHGLSVYFLYRLGDLGGQNAGQKNK